MKSRFHLALAASAACCALALSPARAEELKGADLRHDDPEVRLYMDENLPPVPREPLPPTEEEVALLEEMYEKGDDPEVERTMWVLGDWPGPRNVEVLLRACGDERWAVCAQAATSLGRHADVLGDDAKRRAIERLTPLLDHPERRVVISALGALGALKADAASAKIGPHAASKDRQIAIAALRALGETGNPENFNYVRGRIDSEDSHVALAAIEATGKLARADLARHIVAKLNAESPTQRVAAIRAVASLGAKAYEGDIVKLLDDPHGYIRREALSALAELGGAEYARRYFQHTRDADHTVRRLAAQLIGRFNLVEGAPHLFRLFADGHFYVREDAVDSMVTLDTDQVRQLAADGLTHETPTVRECSSQTLGRLKCDLNLDAHIQRLKDKHLPARIWASWALGEIGRTEASPALYASAFPEREPTEEEKKKMTGTEARQVLEARSCAVFSLGKLRYREALPKCRWLAPQKPTPSFAGQPTLLRRAAARAMGQMKDEAGIGLLTGRLNDMRGMFPEAPDMRLESAVALGRIGSRQSLGVLRAHMEMEEEDYQIRTIARWCIAQITGQEPDFDLPPRRHPTPDYFVRLRKPRTAEKKEQD